MVSVSNKSRRRNETCWVDEKGLPLPYSTQVALSKVMSMSNNHRAICQDFRAALRSLVLLFMCFALPLVSCNDDGLVSNKYCDLPARFSYNPVSAISQLYSACNSMGQWCTITAVNTQFIFANPEGSTSVNKTAVSSYTGAYMGLSGFLVGLPNIPELGSDYAVVTCYELACRNCYEHDHVTKKLTLEMGGTVSCSKCGRSYNLNNQGLVSKGEPGKSLFRYRVNYGNNTLVINNK